MQTTNDSATKVATFILSGVIILNAIWWISIAVWTFMFWSGNADPVSFDLITHSMDFYIYGKSYGKSDTSQFMVVALFNQMLFLGANILASFGGPNTAIRWVFQKVVIHSLIGAGITLALLTQVGSTTFKTYVVMVSYIAFQFLLYLVNNALNDRQSWRINNYGQGKIKTNLNPQQHRTNANQPAQIEPAVKTKPSIRFADIYGNSLIKERLRTAGKTVLERSTNEPRNGILLFGETGNGKTVFAEALAGELKVPLLKLSHSDVASEFVGQRTVHIRAAFEQAIRSAPCLFFIDEIDSFLESRSASQGSNVKEDRDVVNAFLTLMVEIRRHKVILMAATNHMDRLDGAGIREGRFDFKVEITPPDAEARIGLLKAGIKKNLPKVRIDSSLLESVAKRWNGFSVKRILAVTEELPDYLLRQGSALTDVSYDDFMGALRSIQGRRGVIPENVKPLKDLVLTEQTREMIVQITARLNDPEYTESHGGTLPTGVLFYGPPGTGKTATAKAIAQDIQWGFLPVTGADMARYPTALEKTYAKAKEIRPCLIFVDEADELLKNRDYSSSTDATNKLLTLMDGVSDRVKDVVWIAATNNPDMIDPALLRSGRFTEKVVFDLPSDDLLVKHVEQWLATRKVQLARGLQVTAIAQTLQQQSIANTEGVLQAALNRAIGRRESSVVVTEKDIDLAKQSIIGN